MSYANYDDVIRQLQGYGLELDGLQIDTPRPVRCNMDDDKKRSKTGWYRLSSYQAGSGDLLLVGGFGDWREGKVTHKVTLSGRKMSPDEKAAIKAKIAADRKAAYAQRKTLANNAARKALGAWEKCDKDGECSYLTKKQVRPYGVRFSPKSALMIPIRDISANLHGLQIIHTDPETIKKKRRNKDFWPSGLEKNGNFHTIGNLAGATIILVAEGYATAASLREAVERFPVVVAFDAGNLLPVCQAIKKKHPQAHILVCADDDFATWQNPGITSASAVAMAVNGAWVAPSFDDDQLRATVAQAVEEHQPANREEHKALVAPLITGRQKKTDFNDLHTSAGLAMVAQQIEAKIEELGWDKADSSALATQNKGEGGNTLLPISSPNEVMERFALVYGHGGTVFDYWEHQLLKLSDMRDACTAKYAHTQWSESMERKIVRIKEVGFDPAEKDPHITCNLYAGWPTKPKKGKCDNILELLEYLCSGEENARDLFKWVLRWLAYPIKNPGAKMRSCLVVHGPQGAGKNIVFETVMNIYGEYGRIIDQSAVEDKFNDCFSKKLFLIADEVVARQELYHIKNKLKVLVSGEWIRINPKQLQAYDERNHVNLVFLSNETLPVVLERDDRRHCIIWTPPKLPKTIYKEVKEELDDGGVEALHDYLLNLDIGDFDEYTEPPLTQAKSELIGLSMDSTERFWRLWVDGEIEHIPSVPCLSTDFYQLYKDYCKRIGYMRFAPEPKLLAEIGKRSDAKKQRARYMTPSGVQQSTFIFPPKCDQPADKTQAAWLASCVDEFREGFKAWKAAVNTMPMEGYG